ncbi:alpha/beta fold hydrolase [Ilumatobacter sp.]|uniref:alpha/beta fold hydrolase n=1 Tax=Ilumatobacter sp. TaxID=1967498 RepID=UPI003B517240
MTTQDLGIGVTVGYDDVGSDNGHGDAIILFHGLQGGRRMLDRFAAELSTSLRVLNVDQRDSGETTNPADPYDVATLADDAAALLAELDIERTHLFGTSFGGRVAQAFALRHPHLVDRLVLMATWPMPDSLLDVNPAGLARLLDIQSRMPASANELAEFFVPAAHLEAHPDTRAEMLSMSGDPERAARRTAAAGTHHGAASDISARTLVVAGSEDPLIPPDVGRHLATLIAHAEVEVLDGIGHSGTQQDPALVARLVTDFVGAA